MKNIQVVILAAGTGERIGVPKAFLLYNEKETFLSHLIRQYFHFGILPIVVGNKFVKVVLDYYAKSRKEKIIFCENKFPSKGRLYSIKCGLKAAETGNHVLLHDVDMPSVSPKTVQKLLGERNPEGYIIPSFNNQHGHPVVLGPKAVIEIKNSGPEDLQLNKILEKFPRTIIEVPDKNILKSINTYPDYIEFFMSQTEVSNQEKKEVI